MPFALVIIGLLMIVTGAKDTYREFGAQLRGDFTGPGNFTYWLVSIGAVGSLGYIEKFRPLSRAFLILIIVAMVLSNGGFFERASEALRRGPTAPPRQTGPNGEPLPPDPNRPNSTLFGGFGPLGVFPESMRWILDPNPLHWISPHFGEVIPNTGQEILQPTNPMQAQPPR